MCYAYYYCLLHSHLGNRLGKCSLYGGTLCEEALEPTFVQCFTYKITVTRCIAAQPGLSTTLSLLRGEHVRANQTRFLIYAWAYEYNIQYVHMITSVNAPLSIASMYFQCIFQCSSWNHCSSQPEPYVRNVCVVCHASLKKRVLGQSTQTSYGSPCYRWLNSPQRFHTKNRGAFFGRSPYLFKHIPYFGAPVDWI